MENQRYAGMRFLWHDRYHRTQAILLCGSPTNLEIYTKWIENTFEINILFTICEVIFGIPINIDEYTLVINDIILFAKWYKNKKKEQEKPLYFIELLSQLKNKLYYIIFMNTLKDRPNKDWQKLLLDMLDWSRVTDEMDVRHCDTTLYDINKYIYILN